MKRALVVLCLSTLALLLVGAAQIDVARAGAAPPGAPQALGVLLATQQAQLLAADGVANDVFGGSIAISGDTALVGASYDDVGTNPDQGSVYVFTRSGGIWSQQAKLTAVDGAAYDGFGATVALDGDTAVVGTPSDDVGANPDQGSVYVFTRSGTTWSQQAKLTAADGVAYEWFGDSVAVDGDTALAGVPRPAPGIEGIAARPGSSAMDASRGYVYVFTRSGTVWSQQAELTADGWFAGSVAISGDTALVGAVYTKFGPSDNQGSAWVFARTGTTWSQQTILTAADGAAGDFFSGSIAISGDVALVGAPYDDVGANDAQGSAYIFTGSGTTWSQRAKLTAAQGAAYDQFGFSVAIAGDTALVGAPYADVGANADQGSACSFVRCGSTWNRFERLTAAAGTAGDLFGSSVAVVGDTAVAGAPVHGGSQGSAYVFLGSTPGRPSLSSPKGLIASRTPSFRWRPTAGASSYEVRVYRGSKLVKAKSGVSTTAWKCTMRLPRQVWLTWKVTARNVTGWGPWSAALRFKVK